MKVEMAVLGSPSLKVRTIQYNTIQYSTVQHNTTLLSLCREICFLARHLHKNIQYSSFCGRKATPNSEERSTREGKRTTTGWLSVGHTRLCRGFLLVRTCRLAMLWTRGLHIA